MKKNYVIILLVLFFCFKANAQWVKTNGPKGITVTSFFNEDTILLCGTYAQGVFRSSDNGNIWGISNAGLENKWIDCFAKDSTYIYAGSFGEGVFRSSDNGLTWQSANAGIETQAVFCLLVADGNLLAGTVGNGVYLSSDQGVNWQNINGGALDFSFIKAMVYQDTRLMVEADNYIFYSFDFGNSWFVDQGPTEFYQINDFFQKGDTLFAAAFTNLFRSTDGGENWSGPYPVSSSVVGFDRMGDTVYAGSASGAFYSLDWGLSWVQISASGLRSGASDFIISGNNFLLGRQETGIALSSDKGASWTETLDDFPPASTIDNSMTFANGTVYSGTHGNGVFATSDYGDTWNKIGTPNLFDTLSSEIVFSTLHVEPDILLAGGCGDGLFRSADNGVSWAHITDGLPPDDGAFTCVKTLAQCGPNILAALTNGVYYSADNGLTWNPTNLTGSEILQAGGFAVRDSIACVGIIGFPFPTGVYRSIDYGVTWTLAEPLLDIEFMATGGNHTMYCGELFTSYVSYDDGLTWNGMGVGAAFTILAWDNFAFIGNNEGVLFSNDYGSSWTFVNEGLDPYPNNAVQGLTWDSVYVYAGTFRDAVWRRPLSDFDIATSTAQSISESKNLLVIPNPANNYFRIEWQEAAYSNIAVYDALGKLVFNQQQSGGIKSQSILVNCSSWSPGIYLVKANGIAGTTARKIVIAR